MAAGRGWRDIPDLGMPALIAALATVALGMLVLLGWATGLQQLSAFLPDALPMKANAALLLLLLGAAIASRVSANRYRLAGILAAIVLAIASATAFEYATRIDLGIDRLLAQDVAEPGAPYAGRMAVWAVVGFGTGALALVTLGRTWRGWHPSLALTLVAGVIGGLGVLGYLYGATDLTSIGSPTRIAFPAALGFVMLAAALTAADPEHGIMRLIRDPGSAGQIARRLALTAALVVPLGGWLVLGFVRARVLDATLGTALMVIFQLFILATVGTWVIDRARRVERSRARARRDRDQVIENAEDLICVADAQGRLTLVSPSWTRSLGYQPGELLGQAIGALIHPDDLPSEDEPFLAGAGDLERVSGQVNRVRTRDGSYRWFDWNSTWDPDTGCVYAAARDITGRVEAEQAARESEINYDALLATRLVAIAQCEIVVDTRGLPIGYRYLTVNEPLEAMTGLTKAELLRPIIRTAVPGFTDAGLDWLDVAGRVASTGHPITLESYQEHAERWYSIYLYRPRAGRFVAMFSDTTERKQGEADLLALNTDLEAQVQRRTISLEAANAELEAFSYSVSHDLRAPLRSIASFSQILLAEHAATLDTEGRRVLGIVLRNVKQMGILIDDLLAFSRVARITLEHRPVDMGRLALGVAAELQAANPDREVAFDVGPLADAPGDSALLRQVWANLLGNAVKFTGQAVHPAVEVRSERQDGMCRYTVRDNGVGFDATYVGKLFTPFQRLHATSEFEGTGIGLAIVARIVQRHGGTVWADGAPGLGATFGFSLPSQPEAP